MSTFEWRARRSSPGGRVGAPTAPAALVSNKVRVRPSQERVRRGRAALGRTCAATACSAARLAASPAACSGFGP